MASGAGSVAPTGATELRITASSLAIPTIRTVAADLATRADFDLNSSRRPADGGR
jgi:hypothetical protein